jgi:hypothetical protein
MEVFMRKVLAALGCALLVASTAHALPIVIGGGFELPMVPLGSPYLVAVTPTGWTGTGDIAIQGYAGAVSSGDGSQWFDLNPSFEAGTGISQVVALTGGVPYHFSFLYNGGGGGSTTMIAFSLVSGADTLFSGNVSTAAMDVYGGTPWATYANAFTPASDISATLQFMPNGSWSGGFIDAVTIAGGEPPPAVPEPASLLLFGTGLAGLARWRSRRQ